jgi:uncharacterized membrane protein YtjA (UPF0391 family)
MVFFLRATSGFVENPTVKSLFIISLIFLGFVLLGRGDGKGRWRLEPLLRLWEGFGFGSGSGSGTGVVRSLFHCFIINALLFLFLLFHYEAI